MEKIKICHFVNLITGKADGVYTHLTMLFKHIDKNKFEQYLIFPGNENIEREVKALGIKVINLPELNKKFSIGLFFDLLKLIKENQFQIIHTHLLKPYIIAGLCNIFLRRKLIFNYNGLFIKSVYRNYLSNFIYKIAHLTIALFNCVDIAVVPSQKSKYLLKMETGLFKEIRVYYNGADLSGSDIQENPQLIKFMDTLKKNKLIVGVIARLEIQKRIDRALKMVHKIIQEKKDIHFIFFGDGPQEDEMRDFAKSLQLQNYVSFLGFVPNAKQYINKFDVLLLTSDWEGLPLVLWESMSAGIPILSTDVGGVKEILEGEECGRVFSSDDLKEGAEILLELAEDDNMRKKLGENGKTAVALKYNVSGFKIFFENLYNELIAGI